MNKSITGAILWLAFASAARAERVGFDDLAVGAPPKGFSFALTGKGRPGQWVVVKDAGAPSAPNVLAQTDADAVSYRFPLAVLEGFVATDLDLRVRFKAMSGALDQAAGLVWRYRDADHYYIVRANALEGNVVLYKVEGGKRSDLKPKGSGTFAYGKKAPVKSGAWNALRLVARGPLFEVFLNGEKLFEVEDATFTAAGRVGLWTKADSVTRFDDLEYTVPGKESR
jgi:hypothetical protein